MKKFIVLILISLFINFNIVRADPQLSTNIFKEGIYDVNSINRSLGTITTVQNISKDKNLYLIVLDDNQAVIQTIKMTPNSAKYRLNDLEPNFKMILIGDGDAFLS